MSDIINPLLWAIGVLAALSVLYRMLPTRPLPTLRPKYAIFPKYAFAIDDMEIFKRNMDQEGFTQSGMDQYSRGSYFGDFKASWAKLRIEVSNSNNQAVLKSPLIAIAFDTGDLWDIATKLQSKSRQL